MKLVFCGTPEFAVPTLDAVLAAGHDVAWVVTQPDRPAGRGLAVQISPVKAYASGRGIPVVQPERIKKNEEFRASLEVIAPDAIVVVAYGRIIPDWMLELPRFGNINLHGSLLPKYRGAAPIQWAVAMGEPVSGVTTMRLDAGLDTGDMLLAHAVPIGIEETAVAVYRTLAPVGAELMVETLKGLEGGTIEAVPQDHALASLAPLLTREDGRVDFGRTARSIYDRWRGFQPWPGAFTHFRGKKLILSRLRAWDHSIDGSWEMSLGKVLVDGGNLLVRCGAGTVIELVEVQVEGNNRMSAGEFLRGYQVKSGEGMGA